MKNIGHNKPPENFTDQEEKTDLEKLINDAGRVKLTNTIIKKYLNRKYNPENDKYIPVSVNDSEKIGMKARINAGGAISFYYSYILIVSFYLFVCFLCLLCSFDLSVREVLQDLSCSSHILLGNFECVLLSIQ